MIAHVAPPAPVLAAPAVSFGRIAVRVGDGTRFGTGVFIEPKIRIGANSVIGSGCILRGHVPANSVVRTRLSHVLRPPRRVRQSSPEQIQTDKDHSEARPIGAEEGVQGKP